jgi:multiple sugar transport system substrate-binding protein
MFIMHRVGVPHGIMSDKNDYWSEKVTRRRILQGTGAGVAAATAGCLGGGGNGGDGGGSQSPEDLPDAHVLTDYNNDAWQQQWNTLEGSFEDETDIGVEIEYVGSGASTPGRLGELLQAGDPPDLVTASTNHVIDLYASGRLEPVNEAVEAITDVSGEPVVDPLMIDGDPVEIPHGYYTSTLIYRQDIYDELGLSEPTSFETLLENSRAIDNADMDIRGYGLSGVKVGKSRPEFQTFLAQMGVSPTGLRWRDPEAREELEVWWPEEEITTLLQYFKDLSQYSPDPTSLNWPDAIGGYLSGSFAHSYMLNIWASGAAAQNDRYQVAHNTSVQAPPYWEAGGVSKGDSWLYSVTRDGHFVVTGGENPQGAKDFGQYIYGRSPAQTAQLYESEVTRFMPRYDILDSEAFETLDFWSQGPEGSDTTNAYMLDQLKYIQNVILGEHYAQVPEADMLNDPVALFVNSQWFYGELVNRVLTGTDSVQEAYEWGRQSLEGHLEEARNRFR